MAYYNRLHIFNFVKLKGSQPGGAEASGSDAEILHALLPPKEWVQDGQTWIQKVNAKMVVTFKFKKALNLIYG